MKTTTTLALALLAAALARPGASQSFQPDRASPSTPDAVPAAWIQEDPGSTLYSRARRSLQEGRYENAASLFAELRQEHPASGYVADSYYWQAFALFREGGRANYRQAIRLLEMQGREHPDASTRSDADELKVRVEAQLARRGDARAAAAITQQAADPCGEDQEVRMAALSALINMNADRAVPILQEVLRSRDACSAELRERAVFLVAQKMTDESVDLLLDLAHRNPDPDPDVRKQAVFWLSQVDSEEAVEALSSILRETDDPEIAEKAVFALSRHSSDRAWSVIREYAERPDADPEIRANAIFWIGQSGRDEAGGYLREIYTGLEDPELKERVIMGIAQAGGPETRSWLMERIRDTGEDMEVRKQALFWMGQAADLTLPELRDLYTSFSGPELKEQIIFAASRSDDEGAVDFLMEVAEGTDDPEVREKAVFWLAQIDDPRVAEFLMRIIRR